MLYKIKKKVSKPEFSHRESLINLTQKEIKNFENKWDLHEDSEMRETKFWEGWWFGVVYKNVWIKLWMMTKNLYWPLVNTCTCDLIFFS